METPPENLEMPTSSIPCGGSSQAISTLVGFSVPAGRPENACVSQQFLTLCILWRRKITKWLGIGQSQMEFGNSLQAL